jgi:integrase/recombinase XerD
VIDVRPWDGYAFLAALPAYVGKPHLFWHGKGAPYSSFAPTFNELMARVETWAKANGFHHLRHRHAVDWLKSGGGIYTLQGRPGHTSVKTTETYLESLTPEEVQIAKFGAAAKRAAGSTIVDTAAKAK